MYVLRAICAALILALLALPVASSNYLTFGYYNLADGFYTYVVSYSVGDVVVLGGRLSGSSQVFLVRGSTVKEKSFYGNLIAVFVVADLVGVLYYDAALMTNMLDIYDLNMNYITSKDMGSRGFSGVVGDKIVFTNANTLEFYDTSLTVVRTITVLPPSGYSIPSGLVFAVSGNATHIAIVARLRDNAIMIHVGGYSIAPITASAVTLTHFVTDAEPNYLYPYLHERGARIVFVDTANTIYILDVGATLTTTRLYGNMISSTNLMNIPIGSVSRDFIVFSGRDASLHIVLDRILKFSQHYMTSAYVGGFLIGVGQYLPPALGYLKLNTEPQLTTTTVTNTLVLSTTTTITSTTSVPVPIPYPTPITVTTTVVEKEATIDHVFMLLVFLVGLALGIIAITAKRSVKRSI